MSDHHLLEAVSEVIESVAMEHIVPRFNKLGRSEIHKKTSGELVTDVDLAVEKELSIRLRALLPESVIIGEEGVAADPSLLDLLKTAPTAWIVDPVDGTYNFAHGKAQFAVIVALARHGQTVAGWIYQPMTDRMVRAQRGEGAHSGGQPLLIDDGLASPWRGFAGARFRKHLSSSNDRDVAAGGTIRLDMHTMRCAGLEYVGLARNEAHFSVYGSLKPWDHAAGVLIIEEAGGIGRHLDGTPYQPAIASHTPLILAQNEAIWNQLHEWLEAFY